MASEDPIDRFRERVLADDALQSRLAAIEDPQVFAAAALELGTAHGIPLDLADLAPALRPDPLGIARFECVAPSSGWAPRGWLPIEIVSTPAGPVVDWAHFGGLVLTQSFFAGSARIALNRPFNRLFRWQTPLADFVREAEPAPAPLGLVFHWSRCGSTLVSRMLGRLPESISVSEAAPLDAALRYGDPGLLQAMAAALARGGARSFLKLHCWHALAIPFYRAAFPDTPWLFLHRDPVEILVSHGAAPSPEMNPQIVPPSVFGLVAQDAESADYPARVLAAIGRNAIAAMAKGGGLFVDYSALPGAVAARILPHFGVAISAEEAALLAGASLADAKRPDRPFVTDSAVKQAAASAEQKAAAERHLAGLYRQMRALA